MDNDYNEMTLDELMAELAAGEDSAVAEDLATLLESDDWPVQKLVLAAPRSDARRLALDVRYCLEGK